MLDIGFSELMLIGVVALIVIGPERLPRVARTAGHLLGRFQRYVSEVKADINREIELADLKKIQSSVEEAARSIEHTVRSEMNDAQETLRSAEAQLSEAGAALEKTQSELNQALALPHMGMMGASASAVDASGSDSAQPPPAGEPALASAPSLSGREPSPADADTEPSPQLELGLSVLPPGDVPAEQRHEA